MRRQPHPVDVAMALVAEDNDGYFARYHALAAGADRNFLRSRVRSGRYVQHTNRVFSFPGVGRTPRGDLRVALLDAGAFALASHESAAALWGIEGFSHARPSIVVPHSFDHVSPVGVVHQSRVMPAPAILDGIPATPALRTLVDLAQVVSGPVRLGRVIDELVVRRLATLEEVHRGYEWTASRRRPGTSLLAAALDGRSTGYVPSRSELERALDAIVATIPGLVLEREVDLPRRTQEPHRVDRLCRTPPLIVEADGRLYHARLADMEKDRRRDRAALALGYPTVRYGWSELTTCAREVRVELAELTDARRRPESRSTG